jgi:hypothetical protein
MSSSFGIYLLGFVVVTAGLAYAAHLAGVPTPWVVAGIIVLAGLGILKAVTKTTTKMPPTS